MKHYQEKASSWEKSNRWYDRIVGEKGHYYHQHVVIPIVTKRLHLSKDDRLLDVGCGQGVLARHIDPVVKYIGIDNSASLIKQAQKLDNNVNHSFRVEDATQRLSVPPEYFSKAVILLALQNMKDFKAVFQNMAKTLKKLGLLVIVLNHPCFRIPRQSGWDVDPQNKMQKRWITSYMTPMDIPITMHPGERFSESTMSYHVPLSKYAEQLFNNGFCIQMIDELVSDKESVGKAARMENRSRNEIPLFMVITAMKQ